MWPMDETLTIRLDGELMAQLKAEAQRTRSSKGKLVRDAIRERLRRSKPSALDALSDLRGIISGPADLSTNKAYLADMGKRRRCR